MTSPSLPTRLEAILYLKGRPVSIGELAELADSDRRSVEEALVALTASYAQRDSALEIVEQSGRYGLQLRPGMGDLVKDLLPVNLSTATLRTLATIALKKRILQSDLVDLRGSGPTTTSRNCWRRNSLNGVVRARGGPTGSPSQKNSIAPSPCFLILGQPI